MSPKHELFHWFMAYTGAQAIEERELGRRHVVICDLLIYLKSLFHRREIPNTDVTGAPVSGKNEQLAQTLHDYVSRMFMRTNLVVLCCDQQEHVSPAKGPTQMLRSSEPRPLPDYELLNPGLDPSLRDSHNLTTRKIEERKALERTNAERYSFVNDDEPERVCYKLRLGWDYISRMRPVDQRRAIVNASLRFALPTPWEFAINSGSGNRGRAMRYMVELLVFSKECLNPPPGTHLVLDGHYTKGKTFEGFCEAAEGLAALADLPNRPLVLSHNSAVPRGDSESDGMFGTLAGEADSSPLVDTKLEYCGEFIDFYNTIGEADHKILHVIERLQAAKPVGAAGTMMEVITSDTDAFLHILWYLARKRYIDRVPFGELPRVLLNRPNPPVKQKPDEPPRSTDKRLFYDMRQIFCLLDLKVNEYVPPDEYLWRAESLMSLLTVAFASGSDYTLGFNNLTSDRLLSVHLASRDTPGCRPLVVFDFQQPPESQISVCPAAFQNLYFATFYDKHKAKFTAIAKKGALRFPEHLTYVHIRTVGEQIVRNYLPVTENPTIELKAFRNALSQLSKGALSPEQLTGRLLCLVLYVSIVSQLGNANIRLLDPLYFGFETVDETRPPSASNIRFTSDNDLYRLTEKRERIFRDKFTAHGS